VKAVDDEAMAALERYRWPGNVRELQNVIERTCVLADSGTVCPRDLPDHVLGIGEARRPTSTGEAGVVMPEPGTDLTLREPI
jgi:DNA-binding NtrC family response regulator